MIDKSIECCIKEILDEIEYDYVNPHKFNNKYEMFIDKLSLRGLKITYQLPIITSPREEIEDFF